MVNGINGNSINSLQLLRANQAFKKYAESTVEKTNVSVPDQDVKLSIESNNTDKIKLSKTAQEIQAETMRKQYIEKIQQHTQMNVSDEDLKYALKFGRSVLVNRLA
ncbi:MAG: hypothetical protein WCK67_07310 [bacterium]